jgi:exosome complex component RRP4
LCVWQLEKGQLLTAPPYLVKRRKQHFHHLQQYNTDLILGCNGFVWVGQHVETSEKENTILSDEPSSKEDTGNTVPLETRRHICRIANAIRLLSVIGLTLTVESITDTVEASVRSNIEINEMLGAEFYVQTVEREAQRRASMVRKRS